MSENKTSALKMATPPLKKRIPGLTFGILSEISQIFLLILSMWLITRSAEQPPILFLTFAIVGVRAFALGRAALRYFERLASHDIIFAQLSKLRSWSFEKLIPLTPVGLADKSRGDVLSRLVDDLDELQNETLRFRNPVIISLVSIFISLVVVAFISPWGALIIAAGIIIFGGIGALITNYVTIPLTAKQAKLKGELSENILELIENSVELEIFGALEQQEKKIDTAQKELAGRQIRTAMLNGVAAAIVMFGSGVITLFILWFAQNGLAVASTTGASAGQGAMDWVAFDMANISAPVLAAVIMAPAAIYELMNMIPLALQTRALVRESAGRVDALINADLPPEIPVEIPAGDPAEIAADLPVDIHTDPSVKRADLALSDTISTETASSYATFPDTISTETAFSDQRGLSLQLENVSAKYPGAAKNAITNINVSLAPGDLLVVRGDSGSGKSTIARVLERFLEHEGEITLGGKNLRDFSIAEVRSFIGLSEQQPHIFEGSLRDNLLIANTDADDDALNAVLRRVGLEIWAAQRQGLDTQMGVLGAMISGGQAQRVALARVLLADFSVIIFDEPTSEVDPLLAQQVIDEMLKIVAGKTVILITHDADLRLPEGAKQLTL